MDAEKFKNYFDQRYTKELKWYDEKSLANQRKYRIFQWILIVFSSLTPVFIVFDYALRDYIVFLPLSVLSAVIVAVAASAIRTFKYYENWINYRTVAETLKKEIHLYDARIDEYSQSDDRESLFVRRVESLISRENTLWITTYKKDDNAEARE